jgi:AraC family transcriptional regulator, regulatory protein of adaptative response / methylated-DNA-[protein]-cysteine methyltransferase
VTRLTHTHIESPLGLLLAGAVERGVCLLEFAEGDRGATALQAVAEQLGTTVVAGEHPHFDLLRRELALYFAGKLATFEVPLFPVGTDFQKTVWQALLRIPYGVTRSYKQQAATLGNPDGVRAVAAANGRNHIAIIIPCHRVIGDDGSLTGYGGGLWRKQQLLELERASGLVQATGQLRLL